jgi:hypothetical protein
LPPCCDSGRMAGEDCSDRLDLFCGMPKRQQAVCRRANCFARGMPQTASGGPATPVPERAPPLIDPGPPPPAEREPDVYPPRGPIEDPPASPADPNEQPPEPEIEDPPRPDEAPGEPVVTRARCAPARRAVPRRTMSAMMPG